MAEADSYLEQCRHHWLIAPPNGASSMGQCKLCGETKDFNNRSDLINPEITTMGGDITSTIVETKSAPLK